MLVDSQLYTVNAIWDGFQFPTITIHTVTANHSSLTQSAESFAEQLLDGSAQGGFILVTGAEGGL